MVHNRLPDDEYAQDVQDARRLIALSESIHNGKIRDERGEAWYGSQEMLEYDRAVTADMGVLLARIMDYADKVRAERDAAFATLSALDLEPPHINVSEFDPDAPDRQPSASEGKPGEGE